MNRTITKRKPPLLDVSEKRRNRADIIIQILDILSEGEIKPSHLCSKVNTSYPLMKERLDALVQAGYVKERKYRTSRGTAFRYAYSLSDKGFYAVDRLQWVISFLEEVGA